MKIYDEADLARNHSCMSAYFQPDPDNKNMTYALSASSPTEDHKAA